MHNRCTGEFSARCGVCIMASVDRVCAELGIKLPDETRRQLIAGLLARQHLILSGSPGSCKGELARALATSLADGREDHLCSVFGHPWWASGTADVAHYTNMQMAYSEWRLAYFLAAALADGQGTPEVRSVDDAGDYVVCIERMSPAEIDLYFSTLPYKLTPARQGRRRDLQVRFIGTYDSDTPPALDACTLRVAALVHVGARDAGQRE